MLAVANSTAMNIGCIILSNHGFLWICTQEWDCYHTVALIFCLVLFSFLVVLGLQCCAGFSLVVAIRGHSSCSVWASYNAPLVVERRLQDIWASAVVAHGV